MDEHEALAVGAIELLADDPGCEVERIPRELKSFEAFKTNKHYIAMLAKEVMALANSGGGIILFGYTRNSRNEPYIEENTSDDDVNRWDQTDFNKKIRKYMTPSIEVTKGVVQGQSARHVYASIPSHEEVPIICSHGMNKENSKELLLRKAALYIRRAGPETGEVEEPEEWLPILGRCIESMRSIKDDNQYRLSGTWKGHFIVDGTHTEVLINILQSGTDLGGDARIRFSDGQTEVQETFQGSIYGNEITLKGIDYTPLKGAALHYSMDTLFLRESEEGTLEGDLKGDRGESGSVSLKRVG